MKTKTALLLLVPILGACAGRDPQPVATVQPTDTYATCAMITAEIQANNIKVQELADEQGWKVAQNVAAGVAGCPSSKILRHRAAQIKGGSGSFC